MLSKVSEYEARGKEVMICPNTGYEVSDTSIYCPACGKRHQKNGIQEPSEKSDEKNVEASSPGGKDTVERGG